MMIKKRLTLDLILLIAVLFPAQLQAQDQSQQTVVDSKLPSANHIVDEFVDSLGSEMLLRSIKTMSVKGDLDLSMGENATTDVYMSGDRLLYVFKRENGPTTYSGFDGKVWWRKDDAGSSEKVVVDSDEQMFADCMHLLTPGFLKMKELTDQMKVIGKVKFDDVDCYQVNLKYKAGSDTKVCKMFFDRESALVRGCQYKMAAGDYKVVYEFQEIDGVQQVKTIDMFVDIEPLPETVNCKIKFQGYQLNVELDEAMFDGPIR